MSENKSYWKVVLRIVSLVVLALIILLLFFGSAVYAYHSQSDGHALYGQKVLGIDVSNKTGPEIKKLLDGKISAISFTFNVDKEKYSVKPQEAGVNFNTSQTAQAVIESRNSGSFYRPWLKSSQALINYVWPQNPLVPSIDADMSYSLDKKKLGTFAQTLSNKYAVDSKNAALVMRGTEIEVIPAVQGRKIMTDSVEEQIESSMKQIKNLDISVQVEQVDPKILEADTKESVARAKELFSLPVKYTYQGKTFVPPKATVASWIIFETRVVNGKDILVPVFEPRKVYPYIYGLSKEINIAAINKKVTVRNGKESVVEQEGKNGLALDADVASYQTARNLTAGKGVSMELPTYVVKYKTRVNNIVVANWDKYITVDISSQKMCAYLAGGVQVNCWSITTGATSKGYYTPTGTFLIQRKAGAGGRAGSSGGGVCMPNPPYSSPLCGINYVSYFTPQGHAIHEAWWRSSFGTQAYKWNGSHGCVNASYTVAKFIYNWAPIGTPVIISN